MSQLPQTIIDDQDLSKVNYIGNWIKGGGSNENDGTVASSTRVGDSFLVTFSGSSIAVYGTIDATSGGVQTNYTVDNAEPVLKTSSAGAGDTFKQLFYYSDVIGYSDNHTLNVTMVKTLNTPSDPGEGTIWFDYFVVTDAKITNPSKKKPVAKIAGGAVGGVVGLLLILAMILLWRRRRQYQRYVPRQWRSDTTEPPMKTTLEKLEQLPVIDIRRLSRPSRIQPFGLETPTDTLSSQGSDLGSRKTRLDTLQGGPLEQSNPSPTSPIVNTASVSANGISALRLMKIMGAAPPPIAETEPASSSSNAEDTTPETVRHVDSGLRAVNPDVINIPSTIVELPPVYSPV